jgi:hypothetical protein
MTDPTPPLRRLFSRDELMAEAIAWMRAHYADSLRENPDRYHERLGLLVDFVTDLIPE